MLYGQLYLTLKLWFWDYNNTESDEDESEELTPVSLSEAKVSLNKLRNFFLQNHVDADILQASFVLEKSIDKNVGKQFSIHSGLNSAALATIHCRYPLDNWFHVYTDVSVEDAIKNAGAGVYSRAFSIKYHVRKYCGNFDEGELDAGIYQRMEAVYGKRCIVWTTDLKVFMKGGKQNEILMTIIAQMSAMKPSQP
ncbi:hypothetical protein TNCV_2421261 [Trichonephila clavipes]|nr:hypothetical protein TNCV_2421261 [Trichonephila clavipes]